MTIFRNALLAVCAGLPLAALAAPTPSDPAAPVPPVVYQSAVATYRDAPEQDKSPDETWRAANQAVGKAASQPGKMDKMDKIDHMQHMSMKGMKGMNGMPDMSDDAKETTAPPAPADPHQGHHDMQQMQHGQ